MAFFPGSAIQDFRTRGLTQTLQARVRYLTSLS